MDKRNIFRPIVHLVFRVGHFRDKCIRRFAKGVRHKRILELGSGKKHKDRYCYSVKHFFDKSNEFIQSDIVQEYGHKRIDVTQMGYKKEFDIILCMNVLEHVFDFHKAIRNIHKALKPNGIAIIFIPVFYPLHDEPNDYWRFTEHSIKRLLRDFSKVSIKYSGIRQYPFAYYVESTR